MGNALAFGVFIPGESLIHSMSAQVKIILACVFSICVFFIDTWVGLAAVTLLLVIGYALSRIPVSHALRGLKPLVFILVFTIAAHAFLIDVYAPAQGGVASLGSLSTGYVCALVGNAGFGLDGFMSGLFFALRIVLLVAVCSLVTFTTSPVELSDGLVFLMRPLHLVKAPIEDLAMVISIALRFIPVTADEAQTIAQAQKARGAAFGVGGPLKRIRAWIPVMVPLLVRLFRRADELSVAMEARCYSSKTRSHMKRSQVRVAEILTAVVLIALFVAGAWLL